MVLNIAGIIAGNLGISKNQVDNTIALINEGATVPFIARYRKERTGGLDEVQVLQVKDQNEKYNTLEKRKESILKTIEEQGKMTQALKERIEGCYHPGELEDIYLPFRPKRRTRAAIARENGLEPLALLLFAQQEKNIERHASRFIGEKVASAEDALSGARDIIAEWISENEYARNIVRQEFEKQGVIRSAAVKGKEQDGVKYKDYYSWEEPLKKCPSHRLLAMRRGEKEGFLRVSIHPGNQQVAERLIHHFVKGYGASSDQVGMAVSESYSRLLAPSIETEFAAISKEKADTEAIAIFADNLRQLLMAPPLGRVRTLGIDPGYRTGCKVVCLDEQGTLLHNETIYPHPPQNDIKMAAKKLVSLIESYRTEAIAIGNGSAGRETETFIKNLPVGRKIKVFVVSEDGASVYSASPAAREEFPGYDVTVRGAVSIGRRLMDPLAELVKIDPKSIGVGQYQHDVDQKLLKKSLDTVVESVVNAVGVNVNIASRQLLTYISGLGPQLAQNLVDYRNANGPFLNRNNLMKVPRMGPKAYEQAAGFLRIPESVNPLDNTAVHPESYFIVEKIADDLQCNVSALPGNDLLLSKINLENYVDSQTGMPTLTDIMDELKKPGRDPRETARIFEFAEGIYRIEDLLPGMILPGIVNNITGFGAFVDIGVKQSGLVHLSEMADRFIRDPNEIVKLHQHVRVKVLNIDLPRKRISLSLKQASENKQEQK